MDSNALINTARSWLGVPFEHQGRSRGGVDCAGLLVCVYEDLGRRLYDAHGYGRSPHRNLLETYLRHNFEIGTEIGPGSILLMRFDTEPQHIAICAGKTMIHAYQKAGAVVEHRFADVWRARVARVFVP